MKYEKLQERGIEFYAATGKISSELPVFYNPKMMHNRDLTVLLLKALTLKKMRIALPLAASGIRGIRILREVELSKIDHLSMNDVNPEAVKLIQRNLSVNGISEDDSLSVSQNDSSVFLLESKAQHYIDIDPFGYPGPFLDAACRRMVNEGVLAVTATDCGALCGSHPAAGKRKYWARPLKNAFMHETGLRILIQRVQLVAAQYGKAAIPFISYSKDHYMRIFFHMRDGRRRADKQIQKHGWLSYCRKCLRRAASANLPEKTCECGSALEHAGPLYIGRLWDSAFLQKIRSLNRYEDVRGFLDILWEESSIDSVGFYDIHAVVKMSGLQEIPKRDRVVAQLAEMGFDASQTHFTGTGIRTAAPIDVLLRCLQD